MSVSLPALPATPRACSGSPAMSSGPRTWPASSTCSETFARDSRGSQNWRSVAAAQRRRGAFFKRSTATATAQTCSASTSSTRTNPTSIVVVVCHGARERARAAAADLDRDVDADQLLLQPPRRAAARTRWRRSSSRRLLRPDQGGAARPMPASRRAPSTATRAGISTARAATSSAPTRPRACSTPSTTCCCRAPTDVGSPLDVASGTRCCARPPATRPSAVASGRHHAGAGGGIPAAQPALPALGRAVRARGGIALDGLARSTGCAAGPARRRSWTGCTPCSPRFRSARSSRRGCTSSWTCSSGNSSPSRTIWGRRSSGRGRRASPSRNPGRPGLNRNRSPSPEPERRSSGGRRCRPFPRRPSARPLDPNAAPHRPPRHDLPLPPAGRLRRASHDVPPARQPRPAHDRGAAGDHPEPVELRWMHDVFGNCVAIARFAGPRDASCASTARPARPSSRRSALDFQHRPEYAATYPFSYGAEEIARPRRSIERHYPDPEREVDRWARQFLRADGPTGHAGAARRR